MNVGYEGGEVCFVFDYEYWKVCKFFSGFGDYSWCWVFFGGYGDSVYYFWFFIEEVFGVGGWS